MRNIFGVALLAFLLSGFASADPAQKPTGDWQAMYGEIHGSGSLSSSDQSKANRKAEAFKNDIKDLNVLASRTNLSLRAIFQISVRNLKRYGYYAEAREIQSDWQNNWDGVLPTLVANKRDIGDFAPLSQWLADTYNKIEASLGYQICYTLRISDLKTLNYGIPVVFAPCKYGETEFELHFIHDAKYRGVAPVVAYWTTSITCSIATYGAGYFFICSPIAMAVEYGVDKWVAPWLAPKIYDLACN